jgi:hypothetical protein
MHGSIYHKQWRSDADLEDGEGANVEADGDVDEDAPYARRKIFPKKTMIALSPYLKLEAIVCRILLVYVGFIASNNKCCACVGVIFNQVVFGRCSSSKREQSTGL